MNTEVNEKEMQLSDAEKKAIMDAREAAKKKEAYTQEMQEFYQELEALCKKHSVAPQLVNADLLHIVKLIPEAIGKQQVVWTKIANE
jgi:hypothetical protein